MSKIGTRRLLPIASARISRSAFVLLFFFFLDFDAIVCDPPYGISTTTAGEEISDLMRRTMDVFSKSTEKGKRIVMAVSNPSIIPTKSFTVVKTFEWYVHKSLTRNLLVLEKN